jgi:cytochrome P450/alpha-ketoglutarate-dependent taurine dioxygenase
MLEFGKGKLEGINLTDPRIHVDSELRELWSYVRKTQPVIWHPLGHTGFWVVSKYHDVQSIYADRENFTSKNGNSLDSLLAGGDPASGKMLAISDGERHLAIRSEILKCLQPSVMKRLNSSIGRSVRERMGNVLDVNCDLSSEFAKYIPLDTICNLMGVEKQTDRDKLYSFSSAALASTEADTSYEESVIARNEVLMLFSEIIEGKQDRLGDDLISDLIRMERRDSQITLEEILYNCYSFFLGGNEEPRFAILGMLRALAENPNEWMRLRNGEVGVRAAVEEILRWTSPVMHLARTVVRDISVNDTLLRAGQIVSLWNCSANFDEDVFTEANRLILDRKRNDHMSFGFGNHVCLGASLARMEISAVIESLVKDVHTIELTASPKPVYSNFMWGLASLPGYLRSHSAADSEKQSNKPECDCYGLKGVTVDFFNPEAQDLVHVKPALDELDPFSWLESNNQSIEKILSRYGGIVFRDFGINGIRDFNKVALILLSSLQDYVNRSTPRTKLGGKIYTATEYSHERHIQLHNENSYSDVYPSKILFYSAIVATHGGETIVADSRRVYNSIDQSIRKKFEKKGVLYVRNYTPGVDLSWQEVFQTENKSEVDAFCQQHRIETEWHAGITELTTRQKCQAVLQHKTTGELVWFNQAHLFHVSALEKSEQNWLIGELGLENVPRNSFYGDGEAIEPEVLSHIREMYDRETVTFQWHRGDLMLLDNVLFAHGRNPFSGTRKVAVAMS